MKRIMFVLAVIVLSATLSASSADAGLRVGGGIHYLRTVGDLKDQEGFDENAISFLGSVKYGFGLLTLEGDLEYIHDYVGSELYMIQPQAYALVGGLIYGGAGIGIGNLEEFGWQDPFYALRAGVDFNLGPVDLDVFGSYRFQKADDLKTLGSDDLDAITFGALIFFGF